MRIDSRAVEEDRWRLRKARALIKLLALSEGHCLHREQVTEALWPGLEPKAASNNLHQVLHAARRALEPAALAPSHDGASSGSKYLVLRDEQLLLCPEEGSGELWVDVEVFEEAASTARRSRDPRAYGAAIDLYSGELLPEDRYEGWAEGRRAELKELYLSLLTELASLHEERGEHEAAIEALGKVAAEEPTREDAHARLMKLYALSGRRGEALGHYERLREVFSRELGTESGARLRRLQREIWAGAFPRPGSPVADESSTREEEASPAGAGSVLGRDLGRHNLPLIRTGFVGREREKLEVKRMLAMTRLLTLTGAGGVGKTRLALEVAKELVGAYPEGVWLVELAPLSDATLVAQAVAQVLGVREQPGRPLLETLGDALRSRRMLLVVDNCEHLVGAVAEVVDALLDSCSHLRILVTSRQALDTAGEVNWVVPSLTLPDSRQEAYIPHELEAYESARLFVQRARQRDPSLTLTVRNARAVSHICRWLGGIPLAIELAAARMEVLSTEQLARRLEDSLKLLSRGERTAEPRQRSLRATLEWSFQLLSEYERVLFGRLSVFSGGWTLEVAEKVCSGEGIERNDVLDLLSELVEKALVVVEAGQEEVRRFRMLEPVRQYAREKHKGSKESEDTRSQHAWYYLTLAEREDAREADPGVRVPRSVAWLRQMETEHANLRAALSWSLDEDAEGREELGLNAWCEF